MSRIRRFTALTLAKSTFDDIAKSDIVIPTKKRRQNNANLSFFSSFHMAFKCASFFTAGYTRAVGVMGGTWLGSCCAILGKRLGRSFVCFKNQTKASNPTAYQKSPPKTYPLFHPSHPPPSHIGVKNIKYKKHKS
jgi:hypothetical protein